MKQNLCIFVGVIVGLCAASTGWTSSYGVRVEVENTIDKIARLPGSNFEDDLRSKLLKHVRIYNNWDFSEKIDSEFRLLLLSYEGIRGRPSELKLTLELFKSTESLARWVITWRQAGYKEGFGSSREIADEIIEFLSSKERGGPLTAEALGKALLDRVPVAFGGRVRSAESIVTSLSKKRYAHLRWSAFEVHCSAKTRTWLDCNGTGDFLSFTPTDKSTSPYLAIEVKPICIYDDKTARKRRIGREDNVVSLVPDAIYLKYSVGNREPLHVSSEACE